MWETQVPSLGSEDLQGNGCPLQHSYMESPWTEEPGRLQSMGLQRVDTTERLTLSNQPKHLPTIVHVSSPHCSKAPGCCIIWLNHDFFSESHRPPLTLERLVLDSQWHPGFQGDLSPCLLSAALPCHRWQRGSLRFSRKKRISYCFSPIMSELDLVLHSFNIIQVIFSHAYSMLCLVMERE